MNTTNINKTQTQESKLEKNIKKNQNNPTSKEELDNLLLSLLKIENELNNTIDKNIDKTIGR